MLSFETRTRFTLPPDNGTMPNDRATSTPDTPDPGVEYTYTCSYCNRTFTTYRAHVGSLRTICDDCKREADRLRVKRWRENNPERARQQSARNNAKQRRKDPETD
jgi:hypothetical protein